MTPKFTTLLFWLPVLAALIVSDLYSKMIAQQYQWDNIQIIPHLLTAHLTFNSGIAFGMFSQGHMWVKLVIIAASGVAILYFLFWLYKERQNKFLGFGIVLLIAGATGNFFERIANGAVTDFLFLHLGSFPLFIFNVADFYISMGFCIVILHSLFDKPRGTNK